MSTHKVRIMKHISAVDSDWGHSVIVAIDIELPFVPTNGLYISSLPGGERSVGPLSKCSYDLASDRFFCEVDPLLTAVFDDIVRQHEERGWNTLQA